MNNAAALIGIIILTVVVFAIIFGLIRSAGGYDEADFSLRSK